MRRIFFLILLVTACHDDVTGPCPEYETITRRGLHADTSITTCK